MYHKCKVHCHFICVTKSVYQYFVAIKMLYILMFYSFDWSFTVSDKQTEDIGIFVRIYSKDWKKDITLWPGN